MQASKIKQRKKDYFRLDPRLGYRYYEIKMISVFCIKYSWYTH